MCFLTPHPVLIPDGQSQALPISLFIYLSHLNIDRWSLQLETGIGKMWKSYRTLVRMGLGRGKEKADGWATIGFWYD
jgi:hypothetical protein